MGHLRAGHHLGRLRVRVLAESYKAIATRLKVTAKSEFREKLGAGEDPIFVCFPKRGLGQGGGSGRLWGFLRGTISEEGRGGDGFLGLGLRRW